MYKKNKTKKKNSLCVLLIDYCRSLVFVACFIFDDFLALESLK